MISATLALLLAPSGCSLCGGLHHGPAPAPLPTVRTQSAAPRASLLVFTRTTGFRHDSIPEGVNAIKRIAASENLAVTHTEDPSLFTDTELRKHAVVIFLNTTGDVLNSDQEQALTRFIRSRKGWVGIHSAADTEYDWPWYGRLVGAYFKSHPRIQPANINILDNTHLSTRHLTGKIWRRTDEWYDYRAMPTPGARILLTLDRTSYEGSVMDTETHPIAWYQTIEGGRSLYTGGGHTKESYTEPDFVAHLKGAILWAGGLAPRATGSS